jgi:hypothetical protein
MVLLLAVLNTITYLSSSFEEKDRDRKVMKRMWKEKRTKNSLPMVLVFSHAEIFVSI